MVFVDDAARPTPARRITTTTMESTTWSRLWAASRATAGIRELDHDDAAHRRGSARLYVTCDGGGSQ
jgi:hypothetical protein